MLIYFHGNSAFSLPNFMTYRASLWDTIRLLHLPRWRQFATFSLRTPKADSLLVIIVIRLYRKCSDKLPGSTGCGPPRRVSDNDHLKQNISHYRISYHRISH
ncbi:MAG: hypothetical protein BECKG1743F_GA0114225_105313 [Candidatus Kentron sp. G]|nr:MAG: hypothetical protein BECKG1743F_GA0114225_105313 [Candidatus Kentron sp. G]